MTSPLFLGIEAGGTRSVAVLADADERCVQRIERCGPANLRLMSEAQLAGLLQGIGAQVATPAAVGIGMAGVLEETERQRVRDAATRVWPGVPCWAGNDLETALAAANGRHARGSPAPSAPSTRVIVISGTGSSCFGRGPGGAEALTGGWGHLLGDRGSGHDIALSALQAVFSEFDRTGLWSPLGQRFLRALQLNSSNDMISWVQESSKRDLASLAVEVFAAAASGDKVARQVLNEAALALARNAVACAGRLTRLGQPVEFVFTGSVLLKQPGFARAVKKHLQSLWPAATVQPLRREGAWGAVSLAQQNWRILHSQLEEAGAAAQLSPSSILHPPSSFPIPVPASRGLSPTEQRNPRSRKLDTFSVPAAVRLMLSEDATLPAALLREQKKIVQAVSLIVRTLRHGGRLFYVGAGTSGRIGLLDASECLPTFNLSPDSVQAIMAGGREALWGSFEAAEDDAKAGADALAFRSVSSKDVVVGIAASGRTPFVWGALYAARKAGAKTILVCFNPELEFARGTKPDLVIAPKIGPEILTGSTRLKAGTATKLLLNIFSTLSMVQLGKVVENLMVDVQPTNAKLRDRAIRIVRELTGLPPEAASAALEENHWAVKQTVDKLRR
jgi:N-acetylmuramic acid 6-phosphate etherase